MPPHPESLHPCRPTHPELHFVKWCKWVCACLELDSSITSSMHRSQAYWHRSKDYVWFRVSQLAYRLQAEVATCNLQEVEYIKNIRGVG